MAAPRTNEGGCVPPHDRERREAMAKLYSEGKTLREIGEAHGITRERVRQLIFSLGLTGKDGGVQKRARDRAARKRIRRAAERDRKCFAIYGVSHAVALEINGGLSLTHKQSVTRMYFHQWRNAVARGIEWQMNLEQWVQVWEASGRFSDRGRTADSYVMARKGDVGPYAPWNVYITTLADNVRDYQRALRDRGVVCADGRKRLPERAQVIAA